MTEDKQPTWPPSQPYDFGQGQQSVPEQSAASSSTPKEEPTGLENVRYDVVTNQGAPDNPKNSREVVERGVVNVAPTKSSVSSSGIDRKIAAYRAYIDSLPELETPEKRAKREKLEKSKKIIGAVSDGLRAMSNLWYASQYAPDMYNHEKDSQLKETNRWIEQAKAERQKNLDEHLRFAIALGDAENERARTMRELEEQQERRRLAREKAKQDAERFNFEKSLWGGKKREQDGKTSKAEQQAITAKVEAEAAPELQQAKIATEIARKDSLDASAANSLASAKAHERSNILEFKGLGRDGKLLSFDKRQAAIDYERREGTYDAARWGDDLEEVTHTNEPDKRNKTTRKSKVKPVKGKGYGDDNKGY